jgi:LysR family hca operon transcriptional activator
MGMGMALVASIRGLALMPAYAKILLPWSVVSRPLQKFTVAARVSS